MLKYCKLHFQEFLVTLDPITKDKIPPYVKSELEKKCYTSTKIRLCVTTFNNLHGKGLSKLENIVSCHVSWVAKNC